jgi:hypothetical protein
MHLNGEDVSDVLWRGSWGDSRKGEVEAIGLLVEGY